MSSEISRVMIFSGFENQALRLIDSQCRTLIRDLSTRLLIQNKWARSNNSVERFAIKTIEELGYNDMFETMICQRLNHSDYFNLIREENKPLSDVDRNKVILLIKQIRAGITSRKPTKDKALELLIPIGKAFFSLKSSIIVAIGLFVKLLITYISSKNMPQFKPLLHRSDRELTKDLRAVLVQDSYSEYKSRPGAEALVNQFLESKLLSFLP
ncbi:hypothetical protein [Vibrio natriegens]|uniref:hypothetical protein n=1 Tax=Vibrio natriegens TaxID=691 RepID=UPI001FBBC6A8|nr:hypothetical protein [Vibrio natriegens]